MTLLKEKPHMNQNDQSTTQRILVVDDENSISELIATSLRFVGFDVRTAASGSQALTIAEEFKPHALILDVMLPDQDGFEVCRQLRQDGHSVGVLFLTAKDTVEDKIAGLTIGGDDYVTKPFSLEELVARLLDVFSDQQLLILLHTLLLFFNLLLLFFDLLLLFFNLLLLLPQLRLLAFKSDVLFAQPGVLVHRVQR